MLLEGRQKLSSESMRPVHAALAFTGNGAALNLITLFICTLDVLADVQAYSACMTTLLLNMLSSRIMQHVVCSLETALVYLLSTQLDHYPFGFMNIRTISNKQSCEAGQTSFEAERHHPATTLYHTGSCFGWLIPSQQYATVLVNVIDAATLSHVMCAGVKLLGRCYRPSCAAEQHCFTGCLAIHF